MGSTGGREDRTAGSVLVVGSVNTDVTLRVARFPAPGETLLGTSAVVGLGGKGANQAVAAARAGASVRLLATVGDDPDGAVLRRALEQLGVGTGLLGVSTTSPSGRAHITVDDAGQNAIIVVPGANADTTPERLAEVAAAVRTADVVVVQGEVPPGTVAALLELGRSAGVPVVLNLAPVVPLPAAAVEAAAVLVVNESEAALLAGAEEPRGVDEARELARLLARRVPAVVLTVGAQGAVLAQRDGAELHVPAPRPEQVVDTTGAGDALVGVLAAALAAGVPLAGAVADGVRAATRSVEAPGAAASYPDFRVGG